MRVIVEIIAGPSGSKRLVLAAGQFVQIGRTEWADIACPRDAHMSGIHFRIEADPKACYAQDLGSSNGTLLNGQPITQRVAVHDGDKILAGQTHFVIHVEEDTHDHVAAPVAEFPFLRAGSAAERRGIEPPPIPDMAERLDAMGGLGMAPDQDADAKRGKIPTLEDPAPIPMPPKVPFTVERCESRVTLCRGTLADIAPADLAVRLSRTYPVCLIVDFNHLGSRPPPELVAPQYLFDWLGPVTAPLVSPVLLSQTDLLTWPDLVEQGWGADAVICLFTRQDKDAVLEHVRRSCKAHSGRNDAVLGCCWPSVLAPLLSSSPPAFVAQLLTGIDAVLVELPDLPETWQIYGSQHTVDDLEHLGFVQQESENVASS